MQRDIKIYIDNKPVDMDNTISVSLNKQIVDFTNSFVRNAPFSYTIKIPITKTNRVIFKNIDYIHIDKRFTGSTNYKAKIIVNGINLIEGYFILRSISDYFEGNIVGDIKGVILDFGSKTLQDLKLPEIDFEGIMIPVKTGTTGITYTAASSECLNDKLAFDFLSLVNGFKGATAGLLNTSIDYREYYSTPLINYSNFYTDISPTINVLNTVTNNLSIFNFNPSIRYVKVIEQCFKDIGMTIHIDNNIINRPNILFPYVGSTTPDWNWLQLSRTEVYTDTSVVNALTKLSGGTTQSGQYVVKPFISSSMDSVRSQTFNPSNYKIYTDSMNFGGYGFTDTADYKYTSLNANDPQLIHRVHHMPTNGLKYDFNNNFSITSPAPREAANSGWIYTCPADGEYEFEVDITHNIKTYNATKYGQFTVVNIGVNNYTVTPFRPEYVYDYDKGENINIVGYDGTTQGNGTWTYNSQEKYHAANMVCFVKEADFDIDSFTEEYENEFIYTSGNLKTPPNIPGTLFDPQLYRYGAKTGRRLRNFKQDSLIAYYNPMLRDLYTGNHNKVWEDYIKSEGSIMKNDNPIPTNWLDENEVIRYQGFNADTTILEYTNSISYDPATIPDPTDTNQTPFNDKYSVEEQLKRKLVRLKRNNIDAYELDKQGGAPQTFPNIGEASASGKVIFKFKTKLVRGEQIRMYYATTKQFKKSHVTDNYKVQYEAVLPQIIPHFFGWNMHDSTFDSFYNDMDYNDSYFDELVVNSYKVKCIDEKYSSKLKLANFLPSIKQSDFISDFIKSNNLIYNIVDNNVVFKTRSEFYSTRSQMNVTPFIDKNSFTFNPIYVNTKYTYGINYASNDDFAEVLKETNPPIEFSVSSNIYLDTTTLDLTSKIFKTGYDRKYFYSEYILEWNSTDGKFDQTNSLVDTTDIKLPCFSEGGDIKVALADANLNYSRNKRLILDNGVLIDGTVTDIMINSIPFQNIPIYGASSSGIFLDNESKRSNFIDLFTDLSDSSYVECFANIDHNVYSQLDLGKPISISNTLYYIQSISNFNPMEDGMTKLVLLKL